MTILFAQRIAPLFWITALLLLVSNAQGRELSFTEALDLAARNTTELQTLNAVQEMAEGAYQRSAQAFLPRIRADATWLRADSSLVQDIPIPEIGLPPRIVLRDYGPVGGLASSVQVVQPLLNLDAWKARKQADLAREARRLARRWGGEVMHVSVAARYFAVAVHERSLSAARMAVQAAQHALHLAQSSLREGGLSPRSTSIGPMRNWKGPGLACATRKQNCGAMVVEEDNGGRVVRLRWIQTFELVGEEDALIPVVKGVEPGERVVLNPSSELRDGQRIIPNRASR